MAHDWTPLVYAMSLLVFPTLAHALHRIIVPCSVFFIAPSLAVLVVCLCFLMDVSPESASLIFRLMFIHTSSPGSFLQHAFFQLSSLDFCTTEHELYLLDHSHISHFISIPHLLFISVSVSHHLTVSPPPASYTFSPACFLRLLWTVIVLLVFTPVSAS